MTSEVSEDSLIITLQGSIEEICPDDWIEANTQEP
jgi:hypothetical protein